MTIRCDFNWVKIGKADEELRTLQMVKFLLFAFSIMVLGGCNHWFYQPASEEFLTPTKVNLPYQDFTFSAQDGTILHGWRLPAQTSAPFATVIHFHGNGENMSTHFLFLGWLTRAGFDVIEFDYRGYGSSQGIPDRAGLLLDGVAVLKWAATNARSNDLFIFGQSLGGAVAISAYSKNPLPEVRAIILDSTFASYRGIARTKLANFWLSWPLQWPLSLLISDAQSPQDVIADLRVPLVFVHSKDDPVVPFSCGQELYNRAPAPKEFWQVPWGGHTSAFAVPDDRFRRRLVAYLCSHLSSPQKACRGDVAQGLYESSP